MSQHPGSYERRDTGKGKGFGIVEMSDGEAEQAMKLLHGKDINGRTLTVNEAREQIVR